MGRLAALGGRWRDEAVWQAMTRITSDMTGTPADQMTPKMTFY
jgi:hypothetical protein